MNAERELSTPLALSAQDDEAVLAGSRATETCSARPPAATDRSARAVWYAIFLLFAVNVCNYMDRMALAVLMPSIKVELRLSDAQLGLLLGFAFSLFYAICGIPIARWADRGIRRNIIAIALTTWSVMTALSGAAQNFWHLFVARIGVGAGEAGCLPPAQSMISDYVPPSKRAGFYAIHTFGLIVGMMLGMGLAGRLGEILGWRWTFVALGLPGVALALIVRLTLREPSRGNFDAIKDDQSNLSLGQTLGILWHSRIYRLIALFLAANGFVNFGLMQWWPSLYARVFGLGLSSVGVYLGIAIAVGSGTGLLIGGLLANRTAQRDVRLPLMISGAAMALALPAALGSLFIPSWRGSILLVSLTVLFWSVQSGPVLAALYSVVASRMRATAGAISIFFTSLLGSGLGPFCVGLLSDRLTPSLGPEGLRYALLAPICLLPLLVITLYATAQRLNGSLPVADVPL